MEKQIICKHNGTILDEYGYDKIFISDIDKLDSLSQDKIKERLSFRKTNEYDFEYGIGGFASDEYFKIKSISFADNDTKIVVKVSELPHPKG